MKSALLIVGAISGPWVSFGRYCSQPNAPFAGLRNKTEPMPPGG